MKISKKVGIGVILAASAALLVPGGAMPVNAASSQEEILFDSLHFCTRENVTGTTKVHMNVDTQQNPDGSTTVTTRQHAHGEQLIGNPSTDFYVFNERSERVETDTVPAGPSGTFDVETHFIHMSEEQAFAEIPGMDDLKQTTQFTLLRDPIGGENLFMTGQQSRCY